MGDVQVREQCGKECPETLEVDAQGLELYCRDNGENSLVIIVEAVGDHDVDARALDEAVRMAEECFDAAAHRLTLKYDSMKVAKKNIEMAIAKAGFAANGVTPESVGATRKKK